MVFPVGVVSFLFGCLIPNLKALKSWIDGVRAAFLKSVNSNFTLAVRSPKFGQAKTHFLSHHNLCYINRYATFLRTNGVMVSTIEI